MMMRPPHSAQLEWRKPEYKIISERGLSIERLYELFDLDHETGILRWRALPNDRAYSKVSVGNVAGSPDGGKGYLRVMIDGRSYQAHRIVWAMGRGCWPFEQIDHRNGRHADNRPDNLREATHAENNRNCKRRRDNSSGSSGVYRVTRRRRWRAQISVNGRRKHLGYFADKAGAILAVDLGRIVHHGAFACLNNPTGPWMAAFHATPENMRPSASPFAIEAPTAPSSAGHVEPVAVAL